jgi:hypothetical protein
MWIGPPIGGGCIGWGACGGGRFILGCGGKGLAGQWARSWEFWIYFIKIKIVNKLKRPIKPKKKKDQGADSQNYAND